MKRKNTAGTMELKLTVWISSYLSDTQPPSDSCHAYCNVFTGRKCVTFECGSLENGNHSQRATLGGVPILRASNIHHTRWINKVCFGCCEGVYLHTSRRFTKLLFGFRFPYMLYFPYAL